MTRQSDIFVHQMFRSNKKCRISDSLCLLFGSVVFPSFPTEGRTGPGKKSTSMSEQQHVNLNSTSNEEKVTGGQTGGAG